MSEQVLSTLTSSSAAPVTAGTTATKHPLLLGGKVESDSGKPLPKAAARTADLESIAKQLNTASKALGRDLRFQVDLEKGSAVIQVLDRETGEIIRQIPQEKADITLQESGAPQIRLFDEIV